MNILLYLSVVSYITFLYGEQNINQVINDDIEFVYDDSDIVYNDDSDDFLLDHYFY